MPDTLPVGHGAGLPTLWPRSACHDTNFCSKRSAILPFCSSVLSLSLPVSGRATDAKDRHLEDRHQRVKVSSRYPQGHLKLSSSPQVYQSYILGRTQGYLPKNSPEMALRYPQCCPMENVDPLVGPVARPDVKSTHPLFSAHTFRLNESWPCFSHGVHAPWYSPGVRAGVENMQS